MHKDVTNIQLEKQILSLIDLTSLNESDSEETIKTLCQKAHTPFGNVAAVCVYPQFIGIAVTELSGSNVSVATVANFPDGTQTLAEVSESIAKSIDQGAKEIDVVFPYQQFLNGDEATPLSFVESCKGLCGPNILLKVILESGALPLIKITEASELILSAGADFLKTSTGKLPHGATLDAAEMMLLVIRKFSQNDKKIGLKISGGIRTVEQATSYINLANRVMGKEWVSPKTFRIGASQLLDNVIKKL